MQLTILRNMEVVIIKLVTNEELYILAKNGCKESEAELFTQTKKLAVIMAMRYGNPLLLPKEEIRSEGYVGWVKAYKSYNPDIGIKFSTYLSRCIRNHVYSLNMRQLDKCRNNTDIDYIYLDKTIAIDATINNFYEVVTVEGNRSDYETCLDKLSLLDEIDNLIAHNRLDESQKDLIIKRFYEDQTTKDIGIELGISRQLVDHHLKKAFKVLKEHYTNNGILDVFSVLN